NEFNELYETLLKQAGAIEQKLGTLAQEFNEAAEKLQTSSPPTAESTTENVVDNNETVKPKPRRRGGMFGNELTLDD
ncbi:MAG TPA: hypothetical protein HA327_00800, partial [Candidatus Poseidoniaceae archaeon]